MNVRRSGLICLVAEDLLGGVDDADRGIRRAEGAEFLGVVDEHIGIDDPLVLIALVSAVQCHS